MGLTKKSTGINAADLNLKITKPAKDDLIIALAGNPNVGKSTVFNALTGMKQHTGNWPGKTVSNAVGYCKSSERGYMFVDLPGTYSLMSHSAEEDVARNFICFGEHNIVAVVCDATVLERNLNLVLQIAEITPNFIVCVNLLDEAKRKGIRIDLKALSGRLGVSVVGTIAQKKKTLTSLLNTLDFTALKKEPPANIVAVKYPEEIETAIAIIEPIVSQKQNLWKISTLVLFASGGIIKKI